MKKRHKVFFILATIFAMVALLISVMCVIMIIDARARAAEIHESGGMNMAAPLVALIIWFYAFFGASLSGTSIVFSSLVVRFNKFAVVDIVISTVAIALTVLTISGSIG